MSVLNLLSAIGHCLRHDLSYNNLLFLLISFKCIVLTFRLNSSKDSLVINAASAAVRQLFSSVFERVIKEDEAPDIQSKQPQQQLPQNNSQLQTLAPPSLRPAAADAFLLLRDLCALIRREQPSWLIGLQRIAPILGLELLESIIKNYPSIFLKVIIILIKNK